MKLAADLHIHSTLSPCASLEMSPTAIVRRARELSLDVIAVTDHNSVENGFTAAKLAEASGLKVLFGMEAQTREDVHVLCLFEERGQAERFHGRIDALLPDVRNDPDFFGDQVVVDERENIVRHEEKLLLNALDLSIPGLLELAREHGGVCIPAHVEAPPFGLLVNLGMVPAELEGAVMEISCSSRREQVLKAFPCLERHPLISSSDAHYLEDIGRARLVVESSSPSLADLHAALRAGEFRVTYERAHG
ncbi:MAG: PHP domain-containing protein [Candidatus Aminicenantes bacterium]|nr:PHP domain-containing protein [Candidatus Aminicenantes bacterium]